jgi:hypothetical protein
MTALRFTAVACLIALGGGCIGLRSGISYPSYSRSEVRAELETPENDADPGIGLGAAKIKDSACEGIDTHTDSRLLAYDDFTRFLEARGTPPLEIKARGNLYWYDFPGARPQDGDIVRLRLAVLGDAKEAAAELHKSLLEHGPGWWGLRRSNLAILAPKASLGEALGFALRYKLPCWGMVSMADLDDVYVVPGPYMEL